jgi:hypothetical protein
MNRDYLDVGFSQKKVRLPKPQKDNGNRAGNPGLIRYLARLGFYIFVVASLIIGGKFFIETMVAMSRGTTREPIQKTWQEFKKGE